VQIFCDTVSNCDKMEDHKDALLLRINKCEPTSADMKITVNDKIGIIREKSAVLMFLLNTKNVLYHSSDRHQAVNDFIQLRRAEMNL